MKKKLYRARHDKIIGGVCSGIGQYFEIDPTWIRLAFLLLFFGEGAGLLLYIIAWVIIPERPTGARVEPEDYTDVDYYEDDELDNNFQGEKSDYDKTEYSGEGDDYGFSSDKKSNSQRSLGIILLLVGFFFLFDRWIPQLRWDRLWPLVLVAFGVVILVKGVKR